MTAKQFHLGDLISISDGRLVSPSHIGGVYSILGWMTGESLFTHQLPRAMRECRPHLIEQHPWLEEKPMKDELDRLTQTLKGKTGVEGAVKKWLAEAVEKFGEMHPVEPCPTAHEPRDPIEELGDLAGGDIIVPVVVRKKEEEDHE